MAEMTLEEAFASATVDDGSETVYCTVDDDTRLVTIPEKYKKLGSESDEKAKRVWFRFQKMVGNNGIDLSAVSVRVNFRNANGDGDIYMVQDLTVDGDYVVFSWELSRKVTAYKGHVGFVVCAVKSSTDGTAKNEWNTTLNRECEVLEGLEVTEQIAQENPDIIEYILANLGGSVSAEQIAAVVEEYMTAHPFEETDPTVPDWAKSPQKPTYTASEVGALPNTTIIPTTLPNPNALTFTGAATGSYDGSSPVEINIPEGGGTDVAVDATLSVAGQAADAKATGDAISSLSKDIAALQDKNGGTTVYGFHINSNESDPATAVTYLRDAVGMTPAKMNYDTGKFEWGSWKDAFFMPRPCMLKSNGTVAYYLNENNYALKDDGTASDISNVDFDGNAMMEWGRDNKKIWYKIVADADDITSYSVYIADHKEDDNYEAWSFYNKNNELMDHFYTPIYSGSLDASNKLRSLSGQAIMHSKSGTQEISYAKANGDAWNIEVWADKLLMFLLLYLMGKNLDVQGTFGRGHELDSRNGAEKLDPTGALDGKGLFYGYNDSTHKVKVFGMEDQWSEQWNRCAGLMLDNGIYKYKMTEGTADGTSTVGYRTTDTNGMLDGGQSPTSNGYVSKFRVVGDILLPDTISGSSSTYFCDYFYQDQSGVQFALLGGASTYGDHYGFSVRLDRTVADSNWSYGAALSCKPLAR